MSSQAARVSRGTALCQDMDISDGRVDRYMYEKVSDRSAGEYSKTMHL